MLTMNPVDNPGYAARIRSSIHEARRYERMKTRILTDPRVCHGQACVRGTRIPVDQVLRMLENGDTIEDLLREYPRLTRQDILACSDTFRGIQR
jgi:uncharacterized protein (DUF433 family)